MLPSYAGQTGSLEFGTPAPLAGRRKQAFIAIADNGGSPEGGTALNMDDTPTMLLKRSQPSTPGSPTTIGGVKARTLISATALATTILLITVGLIGTAGRTAPTMPSATRRELSDHRELVEEAVVAATTLKAEPTEPSAVEEEVHRLTKTVSRVEAALDALTAKQLNDTASLTRQLAALRLLRKTSSLPAAAKQPAAAAVVHPPAPKPATSEVHVWFVYDANAYLGDAVELYWLSGNESERWYTTIPSGKRVEEVTFPGACWRARTSRERGGHHLISYCANAQKEQVVKIQPQDKVSLDFHYPSGAALAAAGGLSPVRATVYQLTNVSTTEMETLIGYVAPGGHLTTSAKAGTHYRVRDSRSRRVLIDSMAAGHEAEQHIDISATQVSLEFSLSGGENGDNKPGSGAAIYWTWGRVGSFAREHLYAELRYDDNGKPPVPLVVASPPGEQWLVRRASRPGEGAAESAETLLLNVVARAAPAVQRYEIVLPKPGAAPSAPGSSFKKLAAFGGSVV